MNRSGPGQYAAVLHRLLMPIKLLGAMKHYVMSSRRGGRPVPPDGRIVFPGTYILTADYFPKRAIAIAVYCDDVILDLKGFSLGCGETGNPSIGITATGVQRFSVRDGKVTRCDIGVKASKSDDVLLERLAFDGLHFMGVDSAGRGLVVRSCSFANISGYTNEAYAVGVNAPGDDALIERCDFRNIDRQPNATAEMQGEGVGVIVSRGNRNCRIVRNWFENAPTDKPVSIGIFVARDAEATIESNTMVNIPHAVGSESPVVVSENIFVMRYFVITAIGVHLVPGSIVERNTMIGYTQPNLTGVTARDNQLLTKVAEPLPGETGPT